METVGYPVFPCLPDLTLICPPTPTRLQHLTFNDTSVLPLDKHRSKAPVVRYFRGSITYLHQSLSTLRANISGDYARLASGGWLALSVQDWLPVGRLRGVSLLFKVRLITPHLTDLHGANVYYPVINCFDVDLDIKYLSMDIYYPKSTKYI